MPVCGNGTLIPVCKTLPQLAATPAGSTCFRASIYIDAPERQRVSGLRPDPCSDAD